MIKSINQIDVNNKRVLLRCDFNVPIKDGVITDENRILESLGTISYLIKNNASVVLCSHLGKAKGEFNAKYSLMPVAKRLSQILNQEVLFGEDVVGDISKNMAKSLKAGQVMLLENLRFFKGEEQNDIEFCKDLANMAEIYVNDAFGTAHRKHASTAGVVEYGLFKTYAMGLLMEREVNALSSVVNNPKRPFLAILGGAKVSDKIEVINNLLNKVDTLLIGGSMAFTFLSALGHNVGKSLVEQDKKELALSLIERAKQKGVNLVLPIDVKAGREFPNPIDCQIDFKEVDIDCIEDNMMGLDIGSKTVSLFANEIKKANTVLWNGPLGVTENPCFIRGTTDVARAITQSSAISLVGGGDSVAAINSIGLKDKFNFVSTGGGASLKFLEGKPLIGVSVLEK